MKTLKSVQSGFLALALITFVFVTGCGSTAHIERDETADLRAYKTFSWLDSEHPKRNGKGNDLAPQRVREAIAKEMSKNGYREVKNNADLLVTYDLLVERDVRTQNDPIYSTPFNRTYFNPYTRRYGSIFYPSQFLGYDSYNTPVREGTVTITLIDAKKEKTIWQGWNTDDFSGSRITHKEIEKNIHSIFKKFEAKP